MGTAPLEELVYASGQTGLDQDRGYLPGILDSPVGEATLNFVFQP